MTAVSWQIFVGSGTGGAEAVSLQHWIHLFGEASPKIRQIVALISEWLTNYLPPWVAYSALREIRLIWMYKQPGV